MMLHENGLLAVFFGRAEKPEQPDAEDAKGIPKTLEGISRLGASLKITHYFCVFCIRLLHFLSSPLRQLPLPTP
jgi:hypothetical protein